MWDITADTTRIHNKATPWGPEYVRFGIHFWLQSSNAVYWLTKENAERLLTHLQAELQDHDRARSEAMHQVEAGHEA